MSKRPRADQSDGKRTFVTGYTVGRTSTKKSKGNGDVVLQVLEAAGLTHNSNSFAGKPAEARRALLASLKDPALRKEFVAGVVALVPDETKLLPFLTPITDSNSSARYWPSSYLI